jgi:Uma2 family endonuclease
MQGYLDPTLYPVAHPLGYEVWPEQRVRTRFLPVMHYRVPNLCLTPRRAEDIFTQPPFLCIEILSPQRHGCRCVDDGTFRAGPIEIRIDKL